MIGYGTLLTFDQIFNFEAKKQDKTIEKFRQEVNEKVLATGECILNYLVPIPESEQLLEVIWIQITGTEMKRIFIGRILSKRHLTPPEGKILREETCQYLEKYGYNTNCEYYPIERGNTPYIFCINKDKIKTPEKLI